MANFKEDLPCNKKVIPQHMQSSNFST